MPKADWINCNFGSLEFGGDLEEFTSRFQINRNPALPFRRGNGFSMVTKLLLTETRPATFGNI